MNPAPRFAVLTSFAVGILASRAAVAWLVQDEFDHREHESLFPSCETCHDGAATPGRSMWPTTTSCGTCHDGIIEDEVDWRPPTQPRRSNLKFDHGSHADTVGVSSDTLVQCVECHANVGDDWMTVRVASVPRCLSCHEIEGEHVSVPDATCAQCHLPLAEAVRLRPEDVAAFTVPPSHDPESFASEEGHGKAAQPADGVVAASCATCHARDFCITCHVDAPEQPTIQGLLPDSRSLVHVAELAAPADHSSREFLEQHGRQAADPVTCASCHTKESCFACHTATPYVAVDLYDAGPGRAIGAVVERQAPVSHDLAFRNVHGSVAATTPQSCAGCHAREDCLDCHRPSVGNTPNYHEDGFLVTHPATAYNRETSCSDCHNTRSFCADCHISTGLTATGPLGSGYHDANRAFTVGHGQAARQNLESCVSCHAERDCLTCHSTFSRRFNPHGPGFDPERLARKNPEMCLACHARVPIGR